MGEACCRRAFRSTSLSTYDKAYKLYCPSVSTFRPLDLRLCYQMGVVINCNSVFHFCYNPNLLFDIVVYLLSASDARLKAKNASFNGCETELVGSDKTID